MTDKTIRIVQYYHNEEQFIDYYYDERVTLSDHGVLVTLSEDTTMVAISDTIKGINNYVLHCEDDYAVKKGGEYFFF